MKKMFIVYEIRDINGFSDYSTPKALFELKGFRSRALADTVPVFAIA